ncbi:MAG TPA: hypothetical protein VLI39_07870 [Sedimentisphaerales bacterium]|nr:hypothetical protein [Sedimentisphaerales bacterium]
MKTKCSSRSRVLSWAMAAAGLILVLWPETGQGQRSRRETTQTTVAVDPNAAAQPNAWASFDIILKRNIFSRQRTAPRPVAERREEPPRVMPNPESYYLLKGVVQENDDFIAFIEDTQSGTVLRLRRGDPVARGAVKTLTLDGLEYVMEDKTVVVQMGRDLEGGHGNLTPRQMLDLAATPASPPSAPSATSPTTAPSGADSDIIRRLMEQRKQQLGQ